MDKLNNLKALLADKGMTARELATRLGVSQSSVTKWCANANQPEMPRVKQICEILGVNASEFFTF